ncbi:hypothetical protein BASA81_000620 [Batrachochytrium salamandrivorans]|nr:hypothetical protein BASA81_000620 [Batrachochytrium salamandrivorans]
MHVAQCFYHQLFIRGRQDLTDQIRRKTSTVPTKSPSNLFQPEVNVGNYLDGMEEDSAQYQAAVSRNLVLNQRHTELLARIRVLEEGLRTSSPLVSLSPLNTNFASFFSANGNNNNPTIAAVATPRIKTPTPSHMFTMRSSGEQQFFPSVVRSSGEQQPFRGGNVRASSGDGGIMDDDLFSFDLVRSLQWRQSMESTDDRL